MVILQCDIYGTYLAQQVAIVRHFVSTTASSMPSATDFGEQIGTAVGNYLAPNLGQHYTFQSLALRDVTPGSIGTGYVPTNFPVTGDLTSEALPPFTAFKIKLNTADYSYPPFGWVRLCGVVESQSVDGSVTPAMFDDLQDAFRSMFLTEPITSGGAGAWHPCVYSRTRETYSLITGVALQTDLTTQSTRKFGRGS